MRQVTQTGRTQTLQLPLLVVLVHMLKKMRADQKQRVKTKE